MAREFESADQQPVNPTAPPVPEDMTLEDALRATEHIIKPNVRIRGFGLTRGMMNRALRKMEEKGIGVPRAVWQRQKSQGETGPQQGKK